MMQKLLLAFSLLLSQCIFSQSPRLALIEHFTNTRCSICASRNPGFYSILANYPQVLHISYHPSAPYSGCYFSLQNPSENDARTHYYNTYGSTPDFFLNGNLLPAANPAINNTTLDTAINQTSSIEIGAIEEWINNDSIKVRVVVRTTAPNTLATVRLFAGVVENPIYYNAYNGETIHYDVFRKALTDAVGNQFTLPALNDSSVFEFRYAIKSDWDANNVYTLALVQRDDTKEVLNAVKSVRLAFTSLTELNENEFFLSPNPALNQLLISGYTFGELDYSISDLTGRKVMEEKFIHSNIDISKLAKGVYFFRLHGAVKKFVKE
jgi:hypothetical protein